MRFLKLFVGVCLIAGCQRSPGTAANVLRVGATPVPHDEILQQVRAPLEAAGLQLEIVPFNDYVQPNMRLLDGDIDANFYQTAAYLEAFSRDRGAEIVSLGPVHLEPFGLYSRKVQRLAELRDGAVVALPNEVSNFVRGLRLLEKAGLIELRPNCGAFATLADITANPRHLQFKELDAAMLPRVLDSVDVAGINANFALTAELHPSRDALCLEDTHSDYANVLAARRDDAQRPALQQLLQTLQSPSMREFLASRFQGVILPAF